MTSAKSTTMIGFLIRYLNIEYSILSNGDNIEYSILSNGDKHVYSGAELHTNCDGPAIIRQLLLPGARRGGSAVGGGRRRAVRREARFPPMQASTRELIINGRVRRARHRRGLYGHLYGAVSSPRRAIINAYGDERRATLRAS
ncbi:uncharacterized protein LOC120357787 [Solenopsis invicta]|uniref:uncharacterized protein LOC120357787 n=1 Tax=Solenopsis invicta TaxID=13686 RepID=UPI00193E15E0|nr:uncharacterized protein LOC120357787 [Solenopsis invicta]